MEEAEDFESWTFGFSGHSESGKWRLCTSPTLGVATWKRKTHFLVLLCSLSSSVFFSREPNKVVSGLGYWMLLTSHSGRKSRVFLTRFTVGLLVLLT